MDIRSRGFVQRLWRHGPNSGAPGQAGPSSPARFSLEIPDLSSNVASYSCCDPRGGDHLLSFAKVAIEKIGEPDLARSTVLPLLVSQFARDFKCLFPVSAHWLGIQFAIDVSLDSQTKQPELLVHF